MADLNIISITKNKKVSKNKEIQKKTPTKLPKKERQKQVLKLKRQRVTNLKLAGLLNVSVGTVEKDIRELKLKITESLSSEKAKELLLDWYNNECGVLDNAWEAINDPSLQKKDKAAFLKIVSQSGNNLMREWQNMGIIKKAADKVEHTFGFTDEELEEHVNKVLGREEKE